MEIIEKKINKVIGSAVEAPEEVEAPKVAWLERHALVPRMTWAQRALRRSFHVLPTWMLTARS